MSVDTKPLLLVVGGAGYVGRLVLPLLAERWTLRVFDRVAFPEDLTTAVETVLGDVTDAPALNLAAQGVDALLYMAMGTGTDKNIQDPGASYDVNVKGVHLALEAAHLHGIRRVVYTSSLSVHDGHDLTSGEYDLEETPAEPLSVYGHTKLLGEHVARFFWRKHGLPVVILRLFLPVSLERKLSEAPGDTVDCRTSAPDLARALLSALDLAPDELHVIHVTGDTSGKAFRHVRSKAILGWEPRDGAQ